MKITVKQLRRIIKEEVSNAHIKSKIENWAEENSEELEEFFASNPKAVQKIKKAAQLGESNLREGDSLSADDERAAKYGERFAANIERGAKYGERLAAGAKDYYMNPSAGDHSASGAVTGLTYGGPLASLGLLQMPEGLRDSLTSAIGGADHTMVAAIIASVLAGHLADVASHAKKYADKR